MLSLYNWQTLLSSYLSYIFCNIHSLYHHLCFRYFRSKPEYLTEQVLQSFLLISDHLMMQHSLMSTLQPHKKALLLSTISNIAESFVLTRNNDILSLHLPSMSLIVQTTSSRHLITGLSYAHNLNTSANVTIHDQSKGGL